jgi:hypothetical protein
MNRDYLQEALNTFNTDKPQWYSWKKEYSGNKRMSYENIILNDNTATMPTEEEVNSKIQELKDAETQKANDKISAQNKLKALGLTDAEIEAL